MIDEKVREYFQSGCFIYCTQLYNTEKLHQSTVDAKQDICAHLSEWGQRIIFGSMNQIDKIS